MSSKKNKTKKNKMKKYKKDKKNQKKTKKILQLPNNTLKEVDEISQLINKNVPNKLKQF